jgi:hypothetical protein
VKKPLHIADILSISESSMQVVLPCGPVVSRGSVEKEISKLFYRLRSDIGNFDASRTLRNGRYFDDKCHMTLIASQ